MLKHELSLHDCVKVQSTWHMSLKKKDGVKSKPDFNMKMETVVDPIEILKIFNSMNQVLIIRQDNGQRDGSGWMLNQTLGLYLNVNKYDPLKASGCIDLCTMVIKEQAFVNVQNKDPRYFMWCLLPQIRPADNNPHRDSNVKLMKNR